jgi:hypothetical protein
MKKIAELNIETVMARVRNAIYNSHLVWEEVAALFDTSVRNLRYNYVKPYYTVKLGSYKQLCEQERINRANRKITSIVIAADDEPATKQQVLVIETGSVIELGIDGILKYGLNAYIPEFCIRELSKLSETANAEAFLSSYKEESSITVINMRNREVLYVDPEDEVVVKIGQKGS